jgi:hypothetical protein
MNLQAMHDLTKTRLENRTAIEMELELKRT